MEAGPGALRRSAYRRRWLVRHPARSPVLSCVAAAILIQRAARAWLLPRGRAGGVGGAQGSLPGREGVGSGSVRASGPGGGRVAAFPAPNAPNAPNAASTPRLRLVALFVTHYEASCGSTVTALPSADRARYFAVFCALQIQRAWRRARERRLRRLLLFRPYGDAAVAIHARWAEATGRQISIRRKIAARRILEAARRRRYRLQFLRIRQSLLELAEQGDASPLQLLALLSPAEAEMLHSQQVDFVIRFRLGLLDPGVLWPPRTYYKVFLRNLSVVDVAAHAPRNYAVERDTGLEDRRLWYVRVTNNPWRPVSTSEGGAGSGCSGYRDPVVWTSATVAKPVVTSREDNERARRRKKLAWLRQARRLQLLDEMQLTGLLQEMGVAVGGGVGGAAGAAGATAPKPVSNAGSTRRSRSGQRPNPPTPARVFADPSGSAASLTEPPAVQLTSPAADYPDGGVEGLLSWTRALDYDAYQRDWLREYTTDSLSLFQTSARPLIDSAAAELQGDRVGGIPGIGTGTSLMYTAEVLAKVQARQEAAGAPAAEEFSLSGHYGGDALIPAPDGPPGDGEWHSGRYSRGTIIGPAGSSPGHVGTFSLPMAAALGVSGTGGAAGATRTRRDDALVQEGRRAVEEYMELERRLGKGGG